MTPEFVRKAAALLAQATVVEVPGRGHSVYFEDPDSWNEIVARFLAQSHTGPLGATGLQEARQ